MQKKTLRWYNTWVFKTEIWIKNDMLISHEKSWRHGFIISVGINEMKTESSFLEKNGGK